MEQDEAKIVAMKSPLELRKEKKEAREAKEKELEQKRQYEEMMKREEEFLTKNVKKMELEWKYMKYSMELPMMRAEFQEFYRKREEDLKAQMEAEKAKEVEKTAEEPQADFSSHEIEP